MAYAYSATDLKLLDWFQNDYAHALLRDIELQKGHIRSLHPFELSFTYPIAAIAGRNGSGKSTLLAMCACGFHSTKNELPLVSRKYPYFRFSDFFVQSPGEAPVDDVLIIYGIAHNNWRPTPDSPAKSGLKHQHRRKEKGGKWNDYDKRVPRPVAFLGIDRVVPHSEKSISKNYRSYFRSINRAGWEDQVRSRVSKVLGVPYEDFEFSRYTKYRMPRVRRGKETYSGFNMGAGENALFELFSILLSSPEGTLTVVDEIELGLHEEAQRRLMLELKELCLARKLQIICTTHSGTVLRAVPPEGRLFIESYPGKTIITKGISPSYATGRLSGEHSRELDIFVEDGVAQYLVEACLDKSMRGRVSIMPIGAAGAVVGQMVARKNEVKAGEAIAVMDGDQAATLNQHTSAFARQGKPEPEELKKNSEWFKRRIGFLPGDNWPELWLLRSIQAHCLDEVSATFRLSSEELTEAIEKGVLAGKHREIYTLATTIHLDVDYVLRVLVDCAVKTLSSQFNPIRELIATRLDA